MHSRAQFGHKNNETIQLAIMWIDQEVIIQAVRQALHVDMWSLLALLSQEQAAGRAQEWALLGTGDT